MYAIIADGGRQYKVEEGQELAIDFRDKPAGETLIFEKVLAISDGDGDLQRRKTGHRSIYTQVKISKISS